MAAPGQRGELYLTVDLGATNPAFEGSYKNRLSKQLYLELLLNFLFESTSKREKRENLNFNNGV